MEMAYKFRAYPNKQQEILINKTFGCCRYVYNSFLDTRKKKYENNKENYNYNKCSSDLTKLKKELLWLKEPDKFSLQNSLKDLEVAYKNFFNNKENGFPKFKSKKTNRFSYRTNFTNNNIQYLGTKIKLPKLGFIKIKDKKKPSGRILNATISKEPSGKYYISLCCIDVEFEKFNKSYNNIGLDLGIHDFCTISNGEVIENNRFLEKSLNKLAKAQRNLSRKTIGSSNRNKARIKVARIKEKIKNQKIDFLHKTSTKLIKENDIICVETLEVKKMIKNKKGKKSKIFNRSLMSGSLSEFVRQLEYKANWHDKIIVKVDKYYASSQICNACGYKNIKVKDLNIRNWICPKCNTSHQRDLNASINILNEGIRILNK